MITSLLWLDILEGEVKIMLGVFTQPPTRSPDLGTGRLQLPPP